MKFVFFGTPRFAAIVLGRLIDKGFPPVAVVTNPDRPVGRKQVMTPPIAKTICRKLNPGIPVLQPEKIDEEFLKTLRDIGADFFLVAAYGKILSKTLLDIPRLGTIGVHPSLLPSLRGSTPIQTAILNGLDETGVSLFVVDEKMDHGPIVMRKTLEIHSHDNTESLSDRLASLGADMVAEIIPSMEDITPTEQDESEATFTTKISSADAFIESDDILKAEMEDEDLADVIDRKIRAYSPEPGAWTMKDGKRMKILDSAIEDGLLKIKSIQFEGKKPTLIQ